MTRRILILFVLIYAARLPAQEIIRGTYSYTYGDSESLVQARQTCKNLAIRDAIESYYVFVESTTKVENAQTKEDLIQSISTGVVQNLKATDQKEEGRTITIMVEGTVNPEQVRQLVDQKAASLASSKDTTQVNKPAKQTALSEGDELQFHAILSKYENRMETIQRAWTAKQYDTAIGQLADIQEWLEKSQPKATNRFSGILFQSIKTRTEILSDLAQKDKLESQNRKIRERAAVRNLQAKTEQLIRQMRALEELTGLTEKQQMVRKWWLGMCRMTLVKIKYETVQKRIL